MHKTRLSLARLAALLASLFLGLGILATPAAHATPQTAPAAGLPKVLRVGTEGVYPPFSYHDSSGKLTGFDVDLISLIGKRLGVKVQFVQTPWDSMFAALEARRIDLVANEVTLNPERQAKYDLSTPYITTTGVVVVASGNTSIKSLQDLKGKKAAENTTSNWAATARHAGAQIVSVTAMDKAVAALTAGRVDAMVNDELAVKNYLNTTGNTGVKIVATTDDKSQSVFAARKGSGYMAAIDKEIAAMRQDGSLAKIYNQYFGSKAEQKSTTSDWQIVKDNAWPMLQATLKTTIPLTAISFVIGVLIAVGIALLRRSRVLVLSALARVYISIIRGTPLLVQLVIVFFALPQIGVKFSPFWSAVIALSLNVGGYGAEIVRSAISSVPKGQWEAAETIGMSYRRALQRVILPQAARIAVPPLGNSLVSLVKDTSLTSVILVADLFQKAQDAAAPTYSYLALYSAAAVYYWVICLILNALQGRLEFRLNRYVAV